MRSGGWDHDRLKGKSPRDIGSNPIREIAVIFSWSWPSITEPNA